MPVPDPFVNYTQFGLSLIRFSEASLANQINPKEIPKLFHDVFLAFCNEMLTHLVGYQHRRKAIYLKISKSEFLLALCQDFPKTHNS